MKLYIHFGIYKTGSSFLQSMCGSNRSELERQGIFFPKSEREDDLLAGAISPGNGNGIIDFLKAGELTKTVDLIKNWKKEARRINCDNILVSAEGLIHFFATKKGLDILTKSARVANIEQIACLGFFRDPIDHCLSTFKHRAKRGTIQDFENWVVNDYETLKVLDEFRTIYKNYDIQWSFRKYRKDSNFMIHAFFEDWLGIKSPILPCNTSVNSSLTLSELIIIKQVFFHDKYYAPAIQDAFMKIPYNLKASDKDLEENYRKTLAFYLKSHQHVIVEINKLLNKEEQLSILQNDTEVQPVFAEKIVLNKVQNNALIMGFINATKLSYRLKFVANKLRKKFKHSFGSR